MLAGSFLSFTLAGCVRTYAGGYAAECERHDAAGWAISSGGGWERRFGPRVVHLATRHLYYSTEPDTLIEVSAYSTGPSGSKGPAIRMNPAAAGIEVAGRRIGADGSLRENPFMRPHWRCGGAFAATADLNDCGPPVLTFPVKAPAEAGFVLHLASLEIDGATYAVPDIKYCYIPATSKLVKFHG